MTSQFDDETALTRTGENRFTGQVHDAWNIGANPNGGYLLAIALTALRQAVPSQPDPLSVTVHYLRPGTPNAPCDVVIDLIKTGRSVSTARATVSQAGKSRFEVMASLGKIEATPAKSTAELNPERPDIPPPGDCIIRDGAGQGVTLAIMNRLDIRLNPAHAQPGQGPAEISGWVRFKDGRLPDSKSCALFADAFPPAVFGLLGLVGWVPTVQLTVHVRRQPSPGWIQASFRTNDLNGSLMIEDGCLWDEKGQLIAQSRQLAMLLTQ
ncbi:MAG: acyl-CoA thioesterase [Burkholderiaceae bacterium]